MKTLLIFLVLSTVMFGQYFQSGYTAQKKCIVCGHEWEVYISNDYHNYIQLNLNVQETLGGTYVGNTIPNGARNIFDSTVTTTNTHKFIVKIPSDADVCDVCFKKYAATWEDTLSKRFNAMLKTAIKEQAKRSFLLAAERKAKCLKDLAEKLEAVRNEIDTELNK